MGPLVNDLPFDNAVLAGSFMARRSAALIGSIMATGNIMATINTFSVNISSFAKGVPLKGVPLKGVPLKGQTFKGQTFKGASFANASPFNNRDSLNDMRGIRQHFRTG
jgi:hypothetical protein